MHRYRKEKKMALKLITTAHAIFTIMLNQAFPTLAETPTLSDEGSM